MIVLVKKASAYQSQITHRFDNSFLIQYDHYFFVQDSLTFNNKVYWAEKWNKARSSSN